MRLHLVLKLYLFFSNVESTEEEFMEDINQSDFDTVDLNMDHDGDSDDDIVNDDAPVIDVNM